MHERGTGIDAQANCVAADGFSVVGFGDFPRYSDLTILAKACQIFALGPDANDGLLESDVRLNKIQARWTANPTMSELTNGTCQASEVTLGRGDAVGLNQKYP